MAQMRVGIRPWIARRRSSRPILLGVIVRLAIAVVLVVLGAGVEGQQPFEQVGVDRQCDQRAPGGVAAGEVPMLQE